MANGTCRMTNAERGRCDLDDVMSLAASFMLLVGAGLLTRSLYRLYAIDPGFNLSNVLSLQAPDFRQPNRDRRQQFSRDVLEHVSGEMIRQLDPNRPIDHVQTLEEIRDESIA